MRDEDNVRIATAFLGVALGIGGYALLGAFDWRVAVGAFLIHWAINIDRQPRI